jgi:ribosomal protein L40E
MGKFCINCGAELKDKAAFCGNCGSAVANQSHSSGSLTGNSMPGLVGFSGHINDPEVIKKIEDGNKKGRGCIFIGISLPLIIYLIVSFVSDEVDTMDALVFGGGLSVLFLLIYLFGEYLTNVKHTWDGIVTDKETKNKTRRYRDGEIKHYVEYTVSFRTDSGKKHYSVGRSIGDPECRLYYDYLNVGDRVRYHPQLSFKYEKYDKSHDRAIPCMFCKTMNDIRDDRCKACKSLLFK